MTHHSRLGTSEAGTVYLSAVSPVPGVIQDSRATQALTWAGGSTRASSAAFTDTSFK